MMCKARIQGRTRKKFLLVKEYGYIREPTLADTMNLGEKELEAFAVLKDAMYPVCRSDK